MVERALKTQTQNWLNDVEQYVIKPPQTWMKRQKRTVLGKFY